MADIIQFIPKAGREAKANVKDFIDLCRNELTIFGDVKWEDSWDITESMNKRGRSGRIALVWSNHDTSKTNINAELMAEPFVGFARAYMRYQHGMKPTKDILKRLAALRALERALSEHNALPDISKSDVVIFNRAAALIKEKYAPSSAYRVAGQLGLIAKFINDHSMVSARFSWKNPVKRNKDRNRVGRKFDDERSRKLPQPGALDALAKAFHLATEPADIIIASTAALLTTAPSRINELLRLPADCEVEQQNADGNTAYGIRWWPSKGAEPYVKWIGPTMVDVAKEAVKRLREATDHARIVAKWYEENPGSMWLPAECEHLRSQPVSLTVDFAPALGMNRNSTNAWLRTNKIPTEKVEGRLHVRFKDVENTVLNLLPKGFPILDQELGLKYGDALFVVPRNTFFLRKTVMPCLVEPVNTSSVSDGLGARTIHGRASIFTRLGLKADDGSDIKINTHQFRHWLNTIAQRGGLSQLDIAKWSGRTDVRQNETYDHVTADEMVMMVREIDDGSLYGPLAEVMKKMPLSREEFLQANFPTAHTTEYGFCVHDYSMMPCQKHRDCINCTEHLCIKGDREKTHRIKATLELVEGQVKKAEKAIEEGLAGADRWFEHHAQTVNRLRGLVDILDDPEVPVGAVIQLAVPNEFSQIKNAVDDRKMLGDDEADMLNELRALMGGNS